MAAKKVSFKPKAVPKTADEFVSAGVETFTSEPEKPQEKLKRLTLDIPESLHRKVKTKAVQEGITMADLLRDLLEREYGQ